MKNKTTNNISDDEILATVACMGPIKSRKPRHFALLHCMKINHPYRPYRFKSLTHKPVVIYKMMMKLIRIGRVIQFESGGKIYWARRS